MDFWNFENRKGETICFSSEENWERFVIKGTAEKVGSARPRASIILNDHMLVMTVLKGLRKYLLNTVKISKRQNNFFL